MVERRIGFDRTVESSYWKWRQNPAIIIPTILTNAAALIAETAAILFLITSFVLLLPSRIPQEIVRRLVQSDFAGVGAILLDSSLVVYLVGSLLAAVAIGLTIFVLLFSFAAASEYGAYSRIIENGNASLHDVSYHFWHGWVLFLKTYLLIIPFLFAPIVGILLLVLFLINVGPSSTAILLALVGLPLISLASIIVVMLFTVYAFPAVAMDRVSGFAAIKRSFSVVRRFPRITLTYAAVRTLSIGSLLIFAFVLDPIGAPISSLITVMLSLFLFPILHLAKTMIYHQATSGSIPEDSFTIMPSAFTDMRKALLSEARQKLGLGIRELGRFIIDLRNLPYHLGSVASLTAGMILGGTIYRSGLDELISATGFEAGQVNPLFENVITPILALDLFFHNWQVSLGAIFAGTFFLIPASLTLLFNGIVLGVVVDLIPDRAMLLSALLPHGVIELPALLFAGSAGLKIGYAILRISLGRSPEAGPELHEVLRQVAYIALGLIPLFIVAGMIEALVTPAVMRAFGWR